MRKIISFLIILLLAATPLEVRAEDDDFASRGTDVILVADVSGSMRFNDANKAMPVHAMEFIEKLYAADASIRVGFIAFASRINRSVAPEGYSEGHLANIKNTLDGLEYVGYTDIGLAMREARKLFEESGSGGGRSIIFFTDGMIEINPERADRTVSQSRREVESTLDAFDGSVPIYSIGLNDNGSVDVNFLNMLAERTSAASYVTRGVDELPGIFSEIILLINPYVTETVLVPENDPESYNETVSEESPVVDATDETEYVAETYPSQEEPTEPEQEYETVESPPVPSTEPVEEIYITGTPDPVIEAAAEEEADVENETDGGAPNLLRTVGTAFAVIIIIAATAAACAGLYYFFISRTSSAGEFAGRLEIRAVNPDGKETRAAEIELGEYGKRVDLSAVLGDFMKREGLTAEDISVSTEGIVLSPVKSAGKQAVFLFNKGECEITDDENVIQVRKGILWQENRRLTFTDEVPEDQSRWEIIYKC